MYQISKVQGSRFKVLGGAGAKGQVRDFSSNFGEGR